MRIPKLQAPPASRAGLLFEGVTPVNRSTMPPAVSFAIDCMLAIAADRAAAMLFCASEIRAAKLGTSLRRAPIEQHAGDGRKLRITLRQGARVVERNWSTSEAAN